MQDFERERHAAAVTLFQQAFDRGCAAGERALAEGVPKDGKLRSPVYIEVPEIDVVDGDYAGYERRFEEAGRNAALAAKRSGPPVLEHNLSGEPYRARLFEGKMLWIVMFDET